MNQRERLLALVSEAVLRRAGKRPMLVAVDGVDCAGKSTFARELREYIVGLGRHAIAISLDGFHEPRAARYKKGPLSSEGYYEDSFDYARLVAEFLAPVRAADVATTVNAAIFDVATDAPVSGWVVRVASRSIVLFDGIFLLRSVLRPYWDFAIHLHIRPEISLARGIARDGAAMGGVAVARERYLVRYLPAQQRYLATEQPTRRADIVIDNEDLDAPRVMGAPAHQRQRK